MRTILAGTDGVDTEVSIEEYFSHLAGDNWRKEVLLWPPDIFCLIAALMQKSGGYTRYIRHWPPADTPGVSHAEKLDAWTKSTREIGRLWWLAASNAIEDKKGKTQAPQQVRDWWGKVYSHRKTTLDELDKDEDTPKINSLWDALLQLCSASDEACIAMGLAEVSPHASRLAPHEKAPATDMLWAASKRLVAQQFWRTPSTLTWYIKPSLAVVLPKMHTPQSGITLRSISHNLALIRASEVAPIYSQTISEIGSNSKPDAKTAHSFNLLLFPWPLKIVPVDFKPVKSKMQMLAPEFGFFAYEPNSTGPTSRELLEMQKGIKKAIDTLGRIDGVVFPEMAFTDKNKTKVFSTIRKACPKSFMISGIGSPGVDGKYAINKAVLLSPLGSTAETLSQHKHHRWQLDRAQIDQYGLGSQLDPVKRGWWEHIGIGRRELSFLSVSDDITISVLICEDLARQDPIAEIIRSIGPQLIVALLMDGPQLGKRWPARYATVFADDPGSSVLTLTSLGMSDLSRPAGYPPSRVIGLWKDRFQGLREIEIADGAQAVALSLIVERHTEWTADGRKDDCDSTYLRLNGIHQIIV